MLREQRMTMFGDDYSSSTIENLYYECVNAFDDTGYYEEGVGDAIKGAFSKLKEMIHKIISKVREAFHKGGNAINDVNENVEVSTGALKKIGNFLKMVAKFVAMPFHKVGKAMKEHKGATAALIAAILGFSAVAIIVKNGGKNGSPSPSSSGLAAIEEKERLALPAESTATVEKRKKLEAEIEKHQKEKEKYETLVKKARADMKKYNDDMSKWNSDRMTYNTKKNAADKALRESQAKQKKILDDTKKAVQEWKERDASLKEQLERAKQAEQEELRRLRRQQAGVAKKSPEKMTEAKKKNRKQLNEINSLIKRIEGSMKAIENEVGKAEAAADAEYQRKAKVLKKAQTRKQNLTDVKDKYDQKIDNSKLRELRAKKQDALMKYSMHHDKNSGGSIQSKGSAEWSKEFSRGNKEYIDNMADAVRPGAKPTTPDSVIEYARLYGKVGSQVCAQINKVSSSLIDAKNKLEKAA